MKGRDARMALSLVCEPGDPRLPLLMAEFGPVELLARIRGGRRLGERACPGAWIHAARSVDDEMTRVRDLADAAGLTWHVPGDAAWPDQLDDLDHAEPSSGATGAPLGLWVRGSRNLAELVARSVAVVGARDCTAYGAEQAADIAADAASSGFVVVSGAAYGIDACAHRGALAMLRPTVAVLACDAATSYPRAHAALLQRIADEGLVVSEQPPGRVPTKARFLSRNRIIAGLTSGTVVVEARRRSGALNTLAWADQLGRATMGVPGPVTSQHSVGVHQAIRDGKAVLVGSGAEVVAELAGVDPADVHADTAFDRLTADQARVLDGLDWATPHDVPTVARRAGVSLTAAANALVALANAGWATQMESSRWVLARRADLEPPPPPRTVGE